MALIFNGVMQPPSALPGFWIFMYRVSPFTYWVAAMAAAMLHGRQVICSDTEISVFQPPSGQTCGAYLEPYLSGGAPGYLQNPQATSDCGYCSIQVADTFLASVGISWSNRWRNFGLVWVYVFFNICVAVFAYWFFRVRTWSKRSKTSKGKDKTNNENENRDPAEDKAAANKEEEDDKNVQEKVQQNEGSENLNRTSTSTSRPKRPGFAQRSISTAQTLGQDYLTHNMGRVRTNERNVHIV
jgi:hypothetical protein